MIKEALGMDLTDKIIKTLNKNGGVKISGCDKVATIREIERFNYVATDFDGVDWDLDQDKIETFIDNLIDDLEDDNCKIELSII